MRKGHDGEWRKNGGEKNNGESGPLTPFNRLMVIIIELYGTFKVQPGLVWYTFGEPCVLLRY